MLNYILNSMLKTYSKLVYKRTPEYNAVLSCCIGLQSAKLSSKY